MTTYRSHSRSPYKGLDQDLDRRCDICHERNDKCNYCEHCERNICKYCSRGDGPVKDFSCEWDNYYGITCSDCDKWSLKHPKLTDNCHWVRDYKVNDDDYSEKEDSGDDGLE